MERNEGSKEHLSCACTLILVYWTFNIGWSAIWYTEATSNKQAFFSMQDLGTDRIVPLGLSWNAVCVGCI